MNIRKRLLKAVELIGDTETTDPDFYDAWVDDDWVDSASEWLRFRETTKQRYETGVESEDADEE